MFRTRSLSAIAACPLILALALGPRPALAADETWEQTFDGPAVAAHVTAQGGEVVVLAAGSSSNARRDATRALQSALETSGTALRVERRGASEAQADLDDASLLQTLEGEPDRVVIVRVSDGRATVSVYAADGTVIGGFSAARGDTIEPPTQTSHVGDSTLAILEDAPELDDDAVAEYERKRVVFDGNFQVTATSSNTAVVSRGFEPRTGGGAPLPGDEFYEYVGREDLAAQYRRRRGARVGLITTGSLTALTGLTLMMALPLAAIAGADSCVSEDDPMAMDACVAREESKRKSKVRQGLGIGGGLLAGGIVLSVVGARLRPHKASAAEVQEMGETYNRDLRNRLGVRDVAVRGSADRHGGGVVLTGRF